MTMSTDSTAATDLRYNLDGVRAAVGRDFDTAGALGLVAELREYAVWIERSAVAAAREDGMSWGAIGAALGMSRQAAHEKYAHRLR